MLLLRPIISQRHLCRLLYRLIGRRHRRLCSLSSTSCSSGEDYFFKMFTTKHEFPNKNEVKVLKDNFPEPTKLIEDIFQPFAEADSERVPYIKYVPMFNGRMWKACLQFNFPQRFQVTGVHRDKDKAKEYAHLVACEMFTSIGYINNQDFSVFTKEKVFEILHNLDSRTSLTGNVIPEGKKTNNMEMSSNLEVCDSIMKWKTRLYNVKWPRVFTVEGTGLSEESSQHEAILSAAHKLMCDGFVNGKISVYPKELNHIIPSKRDFSQDCTIYVDASTRGFGAYLHIKGEKKIRWLTEKWTDDISSKYCPRNNSSFAEIYALVTALYTWKHKFVKKRVLCYTDCVDVALGVNRCLYWPNYVVNKYENLFKILVQTTEKYEIEFLACYLHRQSNRLADLLAKQNVEEFKEEVPEALEKSKKIKKLLFLEPLDTKIMVKQRSSYRCS